MSIALRDALQSPDCQTVYFDFQVGLEPLRNMALEFLRESITEHNVLKELTSSLVRRHPPFLEMVLDVLYATIASESVVTGFSALAKRIAKNEVPHGARIVIGLHWRLLKAHHPEALPGSPKSPLKIGVKGIRRKV